MKTYIAAPFFTKDQLDFVIELENAFDSVGLDFFSPRSEGLLVNMSKEEREQEFKNIYKSNISHMEECDIMIAVIDNWDTGVCVEIGYYTKSKKPIFTISNMDYGLNVMVREAIKSHNTNIDNLITNIIEYINIGEVTTFNELTKNVT